MTPFKVELIEAQKFQKIWTLNGLAVLLPPEAANFAKDFANVVLNNFIGMCQAQATQAAAKAAEENKSRIITEGL
jgi:hypothetical protein